MTNDLPIDLSPEVRDAIASGAPVVALESTIITHGMPYPDNVSTARAVEDAVRAGGRFPPPSWSSPAESGSASPLRRSRRSVRPRAS